MEAVDYLADERKAAQFDVEAMKVVWVGSKHNLEVADRISRLVASDPVSFSPFSVFLLGEGLSFLAIWCDLSPGLFSVFVEMVMSFCEFW